MREVYINTNFNLIFPNLLGCKNAEDIILWQSQYNKVYMCKKRVYGNHNIRSINALEDMIIWQQQYNKYKHARINALAQVAAVHIANKALKF